MPTRPLIELGGVYGRIYYCIAQVPKGKVATYGQIAKIIHASGARQVGYALSSTPAQLDIPWFRVINAKGEISARAEGGTDCGQLQYLNQEGVTPNKAGRIVLARYQWQPSQDEIQIILRDAHNNDSEDDSDDGQDLPGFG
ncbi:MAG: MGMT family protein [Arenicellales bacterium]